MHTVRILLMQKGIVMANNKTDKIRSLIKEKVDKVKFLRYKSNVLGNLFTTCMFYDVSGIMLARGVSICSLSEPFNINKGKTYSCGRAGKALKEEENICPLRDIIEPKKIKRRFIVKCNKDRDDFLKLIPYMYKHWPVKRGNKDGFEFTINTFYPLEIARAIISYKGEYKPNVGSFMSAINEMGLIKVEK